MFYCGKMIEEINGFFKPTKISHREKQIKELEEVVERNINGKAPKCILIHGFTGSGKTFCTSDVISRNKDKFIYIPFPSTAHSVLKSISDINYNTRERQRMEALEKLKKENKILVIDELQAMRRVEEIKWLLEDLKFIYRQFPFPLIIITNKNLYETQRIIPKDVMSTFHFEKLEFTPYNAIELKDIFQDGISYLDADIPDGFLSYLGAKINKDFDGSVRSGLFVLRECIESNNFSNEKVDEILEKIQSSEFEEIILNLPEQEKKFLSTLVFLVDEKIPEIPIIELRQKMNLRPQRISQIMLNLEKEGITMTSIDEGDRRQRILKFIRKEIYKETKEVIENHNIPML